MDIRFPLRVGILALSCAACGSDVPARADDSAALGLAPAGATGAPTLSEAGVDSLRVRLALPTEVRVGQTVPIVVRLENGGARPLELYLRGRTITFDILITDAAGQVVWQRLKDEVIPAIIQLKVLQPGEILELNEEWRQLDDRGGPVAPGAYMVRGSVLTDAPAALETAPAPLRILPR